MVEYNYSKEQKQLQTNIDKYISGGNGYEKNERI